MNVSCCTIIAWEHLKLFVEKIQIHHVFSHFPFPLIDLFFCFFFLFNLSSFPFSTRCQFNQQWKKNIRDACVITNRFVRVVYEEQREGKKYSNQICEHFLFRMRTCRLNH